MKQKIFSFLVLLLSASVIMTAQQHNVSGVVKDKSGAALIGVAVFERGNTSNGVVTDTLGKFSINVSPEAFLEVSCIGYT